MTLWLRLDFYLWCVFMGVWLLAAPFSRKTVRREPLRSRLQYILAGVVAAVLLNPALLPRVPALAWLSARFVPGAAWVGAISVAMTASGVAFAVWARFTLGRNWSGTVTVKEGHTLVQSGPYAIARHPIYTGLLLALLGGAIGFGKVRALLALVAIAISLLFKMRLEERFMSEQFGEAYAAYRARVKALIPLVW